MGERIKESLALVGYKDTESRLVLRTVDRAGRIVKDSRGIAAAFAQYYKKLYADQVIPDFESSAPLVADLPISRLTSVDRATLDNALTFEEVGYALSNLNSGITPDLDGFLVEYYRKLQPEIPALLRTY
ncbi:hypothetical protein NDU88_005799 [Pleurodeles waltl]|uniref:Uncharacterized protein n=1 Tax=Pleurodeles waltl TaxID=8319 RepID=A0AAV7TC35_PLEWA|nr:hypothetical protein NDU88_005799 [Pleurodeles waltl]